MNHANTIHYATLDDGGLSATMRRIEDMIRRNAPILMRIPDHPQGIQKRTKHSQRVEIRQMLLDGIPPVQIATQLGVTARQVHYQGERLRRANPTLSGVFRKHKGGTTVAQSLIAIARQAAGGFYEPRPDGRYADHATSLRDSEAR